MDKPQSVGEVIHKEKEAKRNTKDKRSSVNSTIVQGSMPVNSTIEKLEEHQNRQKSIGQQQLAKRERNMRLLANAEIDESLHGWIMEGLTTAQYGPWVAKCCHILGLTKVNELAIAARRGREPQKLFSCLLSGARNLHAKQQFYSSGDVKPDQRSDLDAAAHDSTVKQ